MDCKYLFRFRVIPVILFIFAILYACSDDSSSGSRRSNSTSSQRAWYEGGTLHDAGALDWQNASYSNKLATCADIVCYYDSEGLLNPSISNRINSIDDFRPYADDLVTAIDAAFERDPDPEENRIMYTNQEVSSAAVILVRTMGWVN